ncbi:MAG TPA: carbohydrate kinase [Gemmatimonadaceae bacterium]|nr:carbohydrate kinase [Gemmatimonadaceae bacterium]
MPESEVLCVGEVLWDALPEGLFLGGAPFNVACHLRATGTPVSMVSRIGGDRLGDEVLRRAVRYGVGVDLMQVDPALPTGFVRVVVNEAGEPSYEILEPSAWDAIAPTPALLARAATARAIVFGTLAQRHATSRRTIERLWETKALMVLDLNLRPPYDEREIVARSLQRADVVKLSENELATIADWFGLAGSIREMVAGLVKRFDCPVVCVTCGSAGAALWRDGRWTEQPGYPVEVRDTVGAGDAFLAVLLTGLLTGGGGAGDDETLLQHANLIGAYVATQFGALPSDQRVATPPVAEDAPARTRRRPRRR